MLNKIKPIAIHLPQYHPILENNEWWGPGFTEWTNVTKAKALFKGHYQPQLPSDLGFYDLRLEEARQAQITLAKQYGIYGFCYYHYWFSGKRLLHEPLDRMLRNSKEDFPFMLCWANENWTRRWDGLDDEVLIKQDYSVEDDLNHLRFLCENFFSDPRYIRVDGKPFFVVYRPALLPDIKSTLESWRQEARRLGYGELYIGFMTSFSFNTDPKELGFDCKIDFHPDFSALPNQELAPLIDKIKSFLGQKESPFNTNKIFSYTKYVEKAILNINPEENAYPGITPGWDNTARRSTGGATIFKDSSPKEYERWLTELKNAYSDKSTYLFINAWNEWAEGNHLEPCSKWGLQYLEVTRRILLNA